MSHHHEHGGCSNCCIICLCIFIPTLAVFIESGCTAHVLINFLLCCLGWLPGFIHALWYCYYRDECHDDHHHHECH
ncbi:stress response RCI peptide [Aphelenchoides avenae]|nr:stress response RCI peptide [Aphelenchus avenae]